MENYIQWNSSIQTLLDVAPKVLGNDEMFGKLSFGSMLNDDLHAIRI